MPRARIAFFDHTDVFEDFYPHVGVEQEAFATGWAATGNHLFVAKVQELVGDVVWYSFSLRPRLRGATHEVVGCEVRFVRSSWLHRRLWHLYYEHPASWRWRPRQSRAFAAAASYLAPLSLSFAAAVVRHRPDVLFVQDYSSGKFDLVVALGKLLRVPVVAYHAGSEPSHYVWPALKRRSIPRADLLIASGTPEARRLEHDLGVPADRVHVVPTPIDTQRFTPGDGTGSALRLGLAADRRAVVFVGRLDDRVKRVSVLIEAFGRVAGRHADVDLVIVGDGPDRESLEALAAGVGGDSVRFLGWLADDGLPDAYRAASCLVLPSRSEGLPTVVAEAMACAVPVVATAVGAVPDLVEPGTTGWLVRPDDVDDLAAALDAVLADPARASRFGRVGRCRALDRFSEAAVHTRLTDAFATLGVRP